jgi:Zn-dependent protease/CBS domain-containing protein
MKDTFRLGHIAGVRVGVNWSLLAVAALLTFGLAGGRYPIEAAGYSKGAYAAAGLVTAVLFLASVLVHELSHAIVARREGLEVDGISLWLLGGVTRIEGEAATPAAEVRISGSGPLTSFLLGGLFLGFAALADTFNVADLAVAVAAWLGTINLLLAVFNVLPGAPLDGGRLVHAFVWWRNGDRLKATVAASRAGRALGIALIGAGLLMFAYTGAADGLWLSVIGWFLMGAARTEQGQAQLRHALDGVTVANVMTPDPAVAPGWFTVQSFIDNYLLNHRHSSFPIESWGTGLAGMVSLGSLRMVPPSQRSFVRVIDVAVPLDKVPTARPDEPLVALLERMHGADRKALIIDEEGHLVGILTPSDVTRALAHASLRPPVL